MGNHWERTWNAMRSFSTILKFAAQPDYLDELFGPYWGSILIDPTKRRKKTAFRLMEFPGSAVGIFVLPESERYREISPYFLLPMQWIKNRSDSEFLPENIKRVADSVRTVTETRKWGLFFHEKLEASLYNHGEKINFDLHLDAESVWAPLAAGLILAREGGRVQQHVLSTGIWSDRGIGQVSGIEDKIRAIATFSELLSSDKTVHFFVPHVHAEYAGQFVADQGFNIKIHAYPKANESDCKRVLSEHLAMLSVPPDVSEPFDRRLQYANFDWFKQQRNEIVRNYYLKNLVDDLAEFIRSKSQLHGIRLRRLVLNLSKNYETAVLLLKVFRPEKGLLLCTSGEDGSEQHFSKVETYCSNIEKQVITLGSEEKYLPVIREFLNSGGTGKKAVEITGGTKSMSALLIAAAQHTDSNIYYLDHQTKNRQPIYGGEKIRELDWLKIPTC